MRENFADALTRVLAHEGGFANHPRDPGGATMRGVTLANFRRYVDPNGTVADLKAITRDQLEDVYRDHYWHAVKGDDLQSGVDYSVFDFGVNSGPSRAARYLQGVVGVDEDGKIGPVTLQAVRKMKPDDIINKLCDRRMSFLRGLSTWSTFGKGWSSRVSGVRSVALRLANSKSKTVTPPAPETPASETPKPGNWVSALVAFVASIVRAFLRKK
jgi:lysozyme family protein